MNFVKNFRNLFSVATVVSVLIPSIALGVISSVILISPTGAAPEHWSGIHNITWNAVGDPGDTVDIIYSTDDFVSTNLIATEVPFALGTYAWDTRTVPDSSPAFTSTYKVRVQSHNNPIIYATSPNAFIVDNTAPTISSVTVPNTTMKIGDVVTATITVGNDSGDTYTLTSGAIDGFTLGNLTRTNATTYTATFTVTSGGTDIAAGSDIPVTNLVLADSADTPNQSTAYSTPISQAADPIDANVPLLSSVSIASNNASTTLAKTGDTVTLSFTANEALAEGANEPVVTIAGNTIAAANVTGSGTTWTATYVMTGGDAEGTIPFTINFKDVATNAGVQVTSTTNNSSVRFDRTDPSLAVANVVGTTIQAADDTIVLTFSEPVVAADGAWSTNELTSITGSVTGVLTLTNAAFNYTGNALTITLNKATDGMYLQNGETLTVDPAANAITDLAANSLADAAVVGTTAVTGDVAAPTVALTYSADQAVYKAGDVVTVTATFNESVKSTVGKPQVAIATAGNGNVAATDMTIGANDTIWTYAWTVPAGTDDDGTATFTVTATDLAGNTNAAATNATKLVDNTIPVLSSIVFGDTTLNVGDDSLVTFTFTEAVTGFDNSDVVLENGTLSTVATSNNITWTATFTPTNAITDLVNETSVNSANFTDLAGNAGSGVVASNNYAIDTVRPTVSIGLSDAALKIGDTSTLTFTFSEAPTDFTVADITAPNGALSAFTVTGDPLIYTATFTPTADTEDSSNLVTVGTAWTDAAANAPAASTDSANYAVDTLRPTVGIVFADTALKAGETSLVTFTWNEVVTGFDNADITTIEGGTLSPVGSTDGGQTYTATFTPTAGLEDASNITTVNKTGVADVAGNAGTGTTSSLNYTIDTLLPTLSSVTIESNNDGNTTAPEWAKEGDIVTLRFTSSEAISTPTVTIGGVAATTVTNTSGNDWVASRALGASDTEGTILFTIDFSDLATNTGAQVAAVSAGPSVFYDRTAPTVDAGTDKEVNVATTQDATTSDAGSGIATWAWTGPGAIVFNPSNTEDSLISATTDGTYTLRLTVTDNAGNVAFDELTFIWDTTRPEPLTSSPSNGSTGISITGSTATVTFDEDIVLTDPSRILLVNDVTGTSLLGAASVSGGNGASAILNLTYSDLAFGTKYRINVKPNSLTDVAGNSVLSNFIAYFTAQIDTIPPVVSASSASGLTTTSAILNITTNETAVCRYAPTDSAFSSMTLFGTTTATTHEHVLTGLIPSTSYDYYVRCADTTAQTNAMTSSAHITFTTATPDTTAPVISNIQSISITGTEATITWTTDEAATSRVEYGLTSAYGTQSAVDATADNTSHSVTLTGLTSGSTYHFRVKSDDALTNAGVSGDNTFATLVVPDTTAPAAPVFTTAAATTNADTYTLAGTVADDGGIRIVRLMNGATTTGSFTIPAGQTTWAIVSELYQETANAFTATATDEAGNVSTVSATLTITEATPAGDTTPPTAPAFTTTGSTLDADTITIAGTAGAELPTDGTRIVTILRNGTAVGSLSLAAGTTGWSFVAPLLQNTTNTFAVTSTDESGNISSGASTLEIIEATAADTTAPVLSNIQATGITTTDATITWESDENATSLVEYGLTSTYGSTSAVDATADNTSHSVALSSLSAGTTYHYRVISSDTLGNTSTSTDNTFTTVAAPDTTAPAVPVITTTATTVDVDTYTITGTAAADLPTDGVRTITIFRGATVVGSVSLPAGTTAWSFIAPLAQNTTNSFTAKSTDAAGNTSAASAAVVITETEGTATLAVTAIDAVQTFGTADNSYTNGWSWKFHITVPTDETLLSMKFADLVSGANSIAAASNIRYSSAQSSNAVDGNSAIEITAANSYGADLELASDLDAGTAGRQIEVLVEVRIPTGTAAGSYSTSYGVSSDEPSSL